MARDPRLLRRRHPGRHDRHAEGDEGRLEHPLLRRAGLHLLAEAGHRGRLPRALQGRPHRPRQGRARLAPGARARSTSRRGDRGPHLQPARLRPRRLVLEKRTELVAREGHRSSSRRPRPLSTRPSCSARTSTTPSGCGRRWSTRTRDLAAARTARYVMRITGDNTEGKAQLDNFIDPEEPLPGHRHHLEAADHRRGCPDLQADRARPAHPAR